MRVPSLLVATGLLVPLSSTRLAAESYQWTGATDGNWSTPANWTNGLPASAIDTAITFNSAVQPATVNDIPGGLTLNSLTFGESSGVRSFTGNALTFSGTNPTLTMLNSVGTGNTTLANSIVLNQTLTIAGAPDFDRQLVLNGVISGTGGLRIISGVSSTNGTNTYSGPTVIAGGLFGGSSNSTFGNSSSITIENGGAFQFTSASLSTNINKPLTISGAGNASQAFALAAKGGTTKFWTGQITLAGNTTVGSFGGTLLALQNINLNGSALTSRTSSATNDRVSLFGVISGNGDLIINGSALGRGTDLTATNTFTGNIFVTSGDLGITKEETLGDTSNVLTLNGGTLRSDLIALANPLFVSAARSIVIGENGGTFKGASRLLSIASTISGAHPIAIQNNVAFTGNNTFTGPLTINPNSTLTASSNAALGGNGTVIKLNGTDTENATLALSSNATIADDRTLEITGTRGRITSQNETTIAATITGPGQLEIGSGQGITFTGNNTHTGGFKASGILGINGDAALGAPTAPLLLSAASLRAANDFTLPATRSITVDGFGGVIDTNNFNITLQGGITGTNADFGKSGQGNLAINGIVTLPEFNVTGGKLSGNGTFQNLSMAFNTTLAPGNSAGILTINNDLEFVTGELNFTGTLEMELGGATRGLNYDAINVGGIVSLNGSLVLTFLNSYQNTVLAGDLFTLITATTLTGEFQNITNGQRLETADGHGSFLVNYGENSTFNPNSLILSDFQSNIPEPTTLALIATTLLPTLRRKRP